MTKTGAGLFGFRFPIGARGFSLIQPPIQWELESLALGVKWPWHKVNHSNPSPTSAEVRWVELHFKACHMPSWRIENFTFI